MSAPNFEVLTPRGTGGVAVVQVRGRDRRTVAASVLRSPGGAPLSLVAGARRPVLAHLVVDGVVLDEVLVCDRVALETIEIHTHAAEAVLATLGAVAVEADVSPADRLLRSALSDAQLELALEQSELDRAGRGWESFVASLAGREPRAAETERAAARSRSVQARALAQPVDLVLCGAQNAGKSTLMNRLLFRERVLTGDMPGLTRDPVRERVALDGYPYELVDTAGEGAVDDDLDRVAIERGRVLRSGALRLLVVDSTRAPTPVDEELYVAGETLVVWTKQDRVDPEWQIPSGFAGRPSVRVSAGDATASAAVRAAVGSALRGLRGLAAAGPVGGPAALTAAQLDLLGG